MPAVTPTAPTAAIGIAQNLLGDKIVTYLFASIAGGDTWTPDNPISFTNRVRSFWWRVAGATTVSQGTFTRNVATGVWTWNCAGGTSTNVTLLLTFKG